MSRPIAPSPEDQEKIDRGDFVRSSGNGVCQECRRMYWQHPRFHYPSEFLTRLCDGRIVKL